MRRAFLEPINRENLIKKQKSEMINIFYTIVGLLNQIFVLIQISAKNPIHRIAAQILIFLTGSFIFIQLDNYFQGLTYIIVYVGAIAILFQFVIMLIEQPSVGSSPEINNKIIKDHSSVLTYHNKKSIILNYLIKIGYSFFYKFKSGFVPYFNTLEALKIIIDPNENIKKRRFQLIFITFQQIQQADYNYPYYQFRLFIEEIDQGITIISIIAIPAQICVRIVEAYKCINKYQNNIYQDGIIKYYNLINFQNLSYEDKITKVENFVLSIYNHIKGYFDKNQAIIVQRINYYGIFFQNSTFDNTISEISGSDRIINNNIYSDIFNYYSYIIINPIIYFQDLIARAYNLINNYNICQDDIIVIVSNRITKMENLINNFSNLYYKYIIVADNRTDEIGVGEAPKIIVKKVIEGIEEPYAVEWSQTNSEIFNFFYPTWPIEFKIITDIETQGITTYIAYPFAQILISIALWTVMIGVISICSPRRL